MKKRLSILLLATLVIFSCKKKEFQDSVIVSPSDFYFNATIDSTPISLKSGVDNYYMYSSYQQDSASGMYRFIADLKTTGCKSCSKSLQIKINDFENSEPGVPAKIGVSVSPKSYPILGTPLYEVHFKNNYNKTASSYLWNFGDNSTSTLANPSHTYSLQGDYKVSLRITSTEQCQQYIENIEKIQYPPTNCYISVTNISDKEISCVAHTPGLSTYKYKWDFGDGSTIDVLNPTHTYAVAGTYPIKLQVIDANNDTTLVKYNIATVTNPMPCLTNYNIESVDRIENTRPFSNITITWTDENGDVYSSNDMRQPASSYFKILSVENYDKNERNETTKKIKINFKCNVYNGARMKTLDNVDAIVGIAYK